MPSLKEVETYLTGLWLLFRQDPRGFAFLDLSDRGALRSFWAAAWALPTTIISFLWWRSTFLETLPEGAEVGTLFFFRLTLVEFANWIVPLVLVGFLCWMVGIGSKFSAVVAIANWMALPVSYAYATLVVLMMLFPAIDTLVALAWLGLMLAFVVSLFRIFRMVFGNHILTISTITMVLLVPSMILSEMLERFLGVFPG
ncbi:hypothetical protein J5N58_13245 [Rhizobium cremeum]|uniref:hypothetical protein n=1 Tax=Rhizobium cremeum TaxID=2813827 RepID=UPI000DD646AD|nr:hypothetical protein [Rhizobium cremeum]MCJ7995043.1 hypothetical protein [Rhizobium cremeum]MCJ8000645.1 hypothetical protein [Rhizobium cremeum]